MSTLNSANAAGLPVTCPVQAIVAEIEANFDRVDALEAAFCALPLNERLETSDTYHRAYRDQCCPHERAMDRSIDLTPGSMAGVQGALALIYGEAGERLGSAVDEEDWKEALESIQTRVLRISDFIREATGAEMSANLADFYGIPAAHAS